MRRVEEIVEEALKNLFSSKNKVAKCFLHNIERCKSNQTFLSIPKAQNLLVCLLINPREYSTKTFSKKKLEKSQNIELNY